MLGKLFKYEWKTSWKVPVLLIGILLIAALVASVPFTLPIWDSEWIGLPVSALMLILLFYFAIIITSVGVTLYFAVRYYKSMFTDEGYLTHTLPVSARQLLVSKILTMSAWSLIAIIAIFASICIFIGVILIGVVNSGEIQISEVVAEFQAVLQSGAVEGWQGFALCMIFFVPAGCISGAMTIVASITLGQMVKKHRILGSIGAYFAITMAVQTVSTCFMIPFFIVKMSSMESIDNMSLFTVYTPTYAIVMAINVALAIGLYFLSEYLVRRKLELE